MSIQKKVIIGILSVSLVLLTTSLVTTYFQVKNVIIEERGGDFLTMAVKTAERIDGAIKEEITTFQYLTSNKRFIEGVKKEKGGSIKVYFAYYLSFVEERKRHYALFVVNEKGRIIASGDLGEEYNPDQSGEIWWEKTYNGGRGKIYVSNIYLDRSTGRRVLDIGIPILDPQTDKVVGGIRSVIDADHFFSFLKEMNFGRTGHSTLVDSAGNPLICTLLPLADHMVNQPLMDLIISRGSGWSIVEDDAHGGRNSLIGFSPVSYVNSLGPENLGGRHWYVFVGQNPKETFAPVKRLLLKVFLLDASIILIISLISFLVVRRFLLRQVNLLHEGYTRIARGDMTYKIDIRTGDEFEDLAMGYNRMAEALRESYSNLERKIEERTRELEKTKNYLESILKYSTDMIITTDTKGRIVTFNEGAEQMLGYTRDEAIGTFMEDYYLHREERGRLLSMIESGQPVVNYETQLVRKDGRIIDISLSLSLLKDEAGKVIGTVGISKDITSLKKAQQQLKEYSLSLESMVEKRTLELEESKSHLEAMLSGIADGVVFTDRDNKITFINDAAVAMFNIKREEALGSDFKNYHSAQSHEKALQIIEDMKARKISSYSSKIETGEKTISAHFSPIMHGGEYLGVIFIARDVTETEKLQKELEASEERYRDLVENSPLMIHSVNAERYFLSVNKTELDILGYTLEEMRQMRLEDIVPEESREKVKEHIERVIREGKSRVEVQFITKDGKRRDVEISATALYHPVTGEFLRTRAFVRDITEIKRLQSELLQNEKLALVGKMSSTIAHELRNPIVPIGGFARLLHKKLEKEPNLKKYTDVIIKEIDRMEMLLHDILYFTKEVRLSLEPVNLNEIINDLLFFYNDTFTDKNIALEVNLSPDLPALSLDQSKMRQALINLFSNAVDAMPQGGILYVESTKIEIEGRPSAVVTIRDTGTGIQEDIVKNIFEPFFTTKIHGLGLGLTLTRNIIELHGGRIDVKSSVGKGTTFTIILPITSP